jgi:hypothetical protein
MTEQATQKARHRGIDIEAEMFRTHFERAPFLVHHDLVTHPLLQLPRLVELAAALPKEEVEYNNGDIPLNQEYLKTPGNGLTVAETLHQIEACRSWMVLKHVERDPAYRQLLLDCLEPLKPHTEPYAPGMCLPQAFIFISSPHAVTPYHCDPEHNFLLQIRGAKSMAVFDRENTEVITQPQLEEKVVGAHRNLPFSDALERHENLFHLATGSGLHVPMHCPHWVRVGDAVSISFSITFRSRMSARREAVLRFNARLRARGHNPVKPGQGPLRDEVKFLAERIVRKVADARHRRSSRAAS